MDMLVLFLLSAYFTVCVVGQTCSEGCRHDQYCCDKDCCDSTGFYALYVIAVIGAAPIAMLIVYMIILLVKMCCKRGKQVAPLEEEKSASGSRSDLKTQDEDISNSENTKEPPSKSGDKSQIPEDKSDITHAKAGEVESNPESGNQPQIVKTGSSDGGASPPSEEFLYKGNKEMVISMPPSSPGGSTSHA